MGNWEDAGRDATRVMWRNGIESFMEGNPNRALRWEWVRSKWDEGSDEGRESWKSWRVDRGSDIRSSQ